MTTEERNQYFTEVVSPELGRLAWRICEATGMDDHVLETSFYQDLIVFYDEQVRRDCWHPALTEAVGDFTAAVKGAAAALPHYRLALEQAREIGGDTHTILIAMAESLFSVGQKELAEACLRDGRAEALRRGDDYYVREADRVLREATA